MRVLQSLDLCSRSVYKCVYTTDVTTGAIRAVQCAVWRGWMYAQLVLVSCIQLLLLYSQCSSTTCVNNTVAELSLPRVAYMTSDKNRSVIATSI
jgi:hypothetical protein